MAINEVNVGAVANDGTGDTLRTSFTTLNSNFTDTTNAAAALVQTSNLDNTAGRVLTTGAGGLMGALSVLPSSDADALSFTTKVSTPSVWTGSPIAGTDANNQGYLSHEEHTTAGFAYQRFIDVNGPGTHLFRRKISGTWDVSWTTL